jgi:hypothetical protein
MNRGLVVALVALLAGGAQVAFADCTDDPSAWLSVYWNDNPSSYGDKITYDAYVDGGEYELALTDVGDWWDGRISAFHCNSDYPAYWWIYDHPECSSYMDEGEGSANLSGSNNDDLGSIKFQCPSDKQRTWFKFCEHHDCEGKTHPLRLYKNQNSYEVVWEMPRLDGRWNDEISGLESGVNGTLPKEHAYWYFYRDAEFNSNGPADLILEDNDDDWSLGSLDDAITSFRLVISDSTSPPTVEYAFAFSLEPMTPRVQYASELDQEVYYLYELTNDGLHPDTYRLEVSDPSIPGWIAAACQDVDCPSPMIEVPLDVGETTTVGVSLVPTTWDVGSVEFRITSLSDSGLVESDIVTLWADPTVALGVAESERTGEILFASSPNPAPGRAEFVFWLPRADRVTLRVYDVTGRVVSTLARGDYPAGPHRLSWDGADESGRRLAGGIYLCRLATSDQTRTRRVVLVR